LVVKNSQHKGEVIYSGIYYITILICYIIHMLYRSLCSRNSATVRQYDGTTVWRYGGITVRRLCFIILLALS